jgi:prepilin-type N-terminal cleavage/methylation domain-containing protein
MKTTVCSSRPVLRMKAAFTISELMIVMAIFSLLTLALFSSQIFGLRLYRISETKLSATSEGRSALNQVRERIRQAKIVVVGTGDQNGFTNVADNLPQLGNALEIYTTTNRNVYTRYYLDVADSSLKRVTSSDLTPDVISRFITNQIVFQAEDFRGRVLTNDENNRVIKMTLEFYQWEYPIASVGQNGLYDYYRLQTRITRRLIE